MTYGSVAPMTSTAALGFQDGVRGGMVNTRRADFIEFMAVGGATLVLLPLALVATRILGREPAEYGVGFITFYAAYVVNDPHFATTYVLFYSGVRRRFAALNLAQRVRYVVAGLVVPVVLIAWAALALVHRSAAALGWMIQLMYLLVGWHYVKQGFGVLSVLSARRGAPLTPSERWAFLAHSFAAWAFAWANPAAPAGEFEEKGVVYRALAHPRWLELVTGALLIATVVLLIATLVKKWRTQGRGVPLVALGAFLITLWSWTIFSSANRLVQYVIPALHSTQYLFFVWLMKRNEARVEEGPPSFGRPVALRLGWLVLSSLILGWLLFHGAPDILDSAILRSKKASLGLSHVDDLGETPCSAVFFVVVSVHHYFMDHVVWRRDNPTTRYLQRSCDG